MREAATCNSQILNFKNMLGITSSPHEVTITRPYSQRLSSPVCLCYSKQSGL